MHAPEQERKLTLKTKGQNTCTEIIDDKYLDYGSLECGLTLKCLHKVSKDIAYLKD